MGLARHWFTAKASGGWHDSEEQRESACGGVNGTEVVVVWVARRGELGFAACGRGRDRLQRRCATADLVRAATAAHTHTLTQVWNVPLVPSAAQWIL